MRILVVKGKDDDSYYNADTEEELGRSCLEILMDRLVDPEHWYGSFPKPEYKYIPQDTIDSMKGILSEYTYTDLCYIQSKWREYYRWEKFLHEAQEAVAGDDWHMAQITLLGWDGEHGNVYLAEVKE